jgi:myo-inositol-1(or 4)-monophosphatase
MLQRIEKIQHCFRLIVNEVEQYLASQNLVSIPCEYKKNVCGGMEEVSRIDRDIERICKCNLASQFPDIPIIAEESGCNEGTTPATDSFFAVDPVDGTLDMLNGGSNWSVSLAAVAAGKTQVAMLYFPKKSITLSAIRGQGAWLNGDRVTSKKNNKGNCKIGVSPRQITDSKLRKILTNSRYKYIEIPHFTPKILALILGEIDVAAYLPQKGKGVQLWDYAAASLALQELGGNLNSLTDDPLSFDSHIVTHKGGWIAVNNQFDHASLVTSLLSVNLDK